MSIKKKTILIIIGVIIATAIIIGGIFGFKSISTSMRIKETENKLSKINAEEFESKLISELKQSKFNINTSNLSTEICNWNDFNNTKQGQMAVMSIEIFYAANNIDNPYEDCVSAYITSNSRGVVAIPLFKIEKDNNGNFKNIVYTERVLKESVVTNAIEKVLKNDYGIDMFIKENSKYNTRFNKLFNSEIGTMYANTDILNKVIEQVKGVKNNGNVESYEEYSLTTFGLDINK